MVNIAVLGYGTVGSGVIEVLTKNQQSIDKKANKQIKVKYVLDRKDIEDESIQKILTKDFEQIINDEEVKVIVEVMGGIEPAYTFVKRALLEGKSVVTSNKELVAQHGPELLKIARKNNLNFLFEASVGGGIPIIRPLNQSLTADEIYEITGILNGTTNYILSKMANENLDFEEVLKEAQDKGYAERNPEADVEGYDACRKIAILSSLAFGRHVHFGDIYTEGITKISREDIAYAKHLGKSLKLIATSKKQEGAIYARVAPMMLPMDHPLATVNGVFNAILIKGNVLGDAMFYGSGAGKLPTASAVVADVIDAARHLGTNIMSFWSTKQLALKDINEVGTKFFIRVENKDTSSIRDSIESTFGITNIIQLETLKAELGFISSPIEEGNLNKKLEVLEEKGIKIKSVIRMES